MVTWFSYVLGLTIIVGLKWDIKSELLNFTGGPPFVLTFNIVGLFPTAFSSTRFILPIHSASYFIYLQSSLILSITGICYSRENFESNKDSVLIVESLGSREVQVQHWNMIVRKTMVIELKNLFVVFFLGVCSLFLYALFPSLHPFLSII